MKRIISGLMIIVWLATIVGGCQTESPSGANQSNVGDKPDLTIAPPEPLTSVEFDTELGLILANEVIPDAVQEECEVSLDISWIGESVSEPCRFLIGKYEQGEAKGYEVKVTSIEDDLLWKYTLAVQKVPDTVFILTEKSHDDSLSVTVHKGETECTETYLRSGAPPLVLSYPIGLTERALGGQQLSSQELLQVQGLTSAYQNWANPNSTLNNNRYGKLINVLKDEPAFAAYLAPAQLAKIADKDCPECDDVCYWARTCALIKCTLLPANPICWGCTGVSIGCWLHDTWDRFFGNDE